MDLPKVIQKTRSMKELLKDTDFCYLQLCDARDNAKTMQELKNALKFLGIMLASGPAEIHGTVKAVAQELTYKCLLLN